MFYFRLMTKQIVLVLFASVLFACNNSSKKEEASAARPGGGRPGGNAPVQAEAYVVKTRIMSENVEVPGSLTPYEETEIRPEISGRLTYLNLREGMQVGKGALLAKLYDGDLQAQL